MNPLLGNLLDLGGFELVVLLVVGMMVFGRQLPEFGRSLGKTLREFKKGFSGLEEEIEDAVQAPRSTQALPVRPPERLGVVPCFAAEAGADFEENQASARPEHQEIAGSLP